MSLESELNCFEEWASTPDGQNREEWEYPHWDRLYAAVDEMLSGSAVSGANALFLLRALALDNELELIRDKLEDHPHQGLLLAAAALSYPDAEARWQMAYFLGTRDEAEAKAMLRQFIDDEDEYVRRRALLACVDHDREFAESTAHQWIGSPHEYSRLAALSILHQLNSPFLHEAMNQLRSDPSPHVRNQIAQLEHKG